MACGGSEGNSCRAAYSGPPWLPFLSLMLPALQTYTASPWWPWDRYTHEAWLSSDALLAEQETFKSFQSHWASPSGFHTGAAASHVSMMSFPSSFALLAEVTSSLGKYHSEMNRASDPKTHLTWLASCWVGSWSPPWTVISLLSAWDCEGHHLCVCLMCTLLSLLPCLQATTSLHERFMAPHVSDASLPASPIVLRDLVMACHSGFLFMPSPFSQVKSGLNKY